MTENVVKFKPKHRQALFACPQCNGDHWQFLTLDLSEGDGQAACLMVCANKFCDFDYLTVIDLGIDQEDQE